MTDSSRRVEESVFFDLVRTIDQTDYKITDEERTAFNKCSSDLVNRFINYAGGLSFSGYALARVLTRPTAGMKPLRNVRAGRAICFMAGGYIGTRIAVQGVRERCLGNILELDSPVGREAEVLLRQAAPDNPLLSRRPLFNSEAPPQPRIIDSAAQQKTSNQEHEIEGLHGMQRSAASDSSRTQRQPGSMEVSSDVIKSRQRPLQFPAEPQMTGPRWESSANQTEQQQEQQPDAFSGMGGGVFGSPSTNDDSSLRTDDLSRRSIDDGWADSQQDFQPAGLDTVRRSRLRTHRGFGAQNSDHEEGGSRWD